MWAPAVLALKLSSPLASLLTLIRPCFAWWSCCQLSNRTLMEYVQNNRDNDLMRCAKANQNLQVIR